MQGKTTLIDLPSEILEMISTYLFEPYDLELQSWIHGHFDKVCSRSQASMFLLDEGRIYENYTRLAVCSKGKQNLSGDSILFVCKTLLPIARRARQQLFSGILHIKNGLYSWFDHDLDDKVRDYCTGTLSSRVDTNFRARVTMIRYRYDQISRSQLKAIAGAFPNLSIFEFQTVPSTKPYMAFGPWGDFVKQKRSLTTSELAWNLEPFDRKEVLESFALALAELEDTEKARPVSCYFYTQAHQGPGHSARAIACLWHASKHGFKPIRSFDGSRTRFYPQNIQARLSDSLPLDAHSMV